MTISLQVAVLIGFQIAIERLKRVCVETAPKISGLTHRSPRCRCTQQRGGDSNNGQQLAYAEHEPLYDVPLWTSQMLVPVSLGCKVKDVGRRHKPSFVTRGGPADY